MRFYTSERLKASTVRALIDAAVQAPTGMSDLPWLFAVVQDREVLRRLSDRARTSVAAMAAPSLVETSYEGSTLIVICARHPNVFVTADCWAAAECLMLAACAMGLGTFCVGAAVRAMNTEEGKNDLGLPEDVTAIVPIMVGVPLEPAPPWQPREPVILSWK